MSCRDCEDEPVPDERSRESDRDADQRRVEAVEPLANEDRADGPRERRPQPEDGVAPSERSAAAADEHALARDDVRAERDQADAEPAPTGGKLTERRRG